MQMDDKWIVRISRNAPVAMEIIDGIITPFKEPLKADSKQMLTEMLGQGMKEEEVIAVLTGRGEQKESIEEEIRRLSV